MAATRFEGAGPVARYWLANCEGFAVRGAVRGVVEELLRDANPHETTRFVVRTRARRRKVVQATAVAAVVPAKRLVVVERARRRPRARPRVPAIPRLDVRRRFRLPPTAPARQALVTWARTGARIASPALVTWARTAARFARPALVVLAGSLRRLGAEVRASAALLVRRFTG
jgi:hypothetical protein